MKSLINDWISLALNIWWYIGLAKKFGFYARHHGKIQMNFLVNPIHYSLCKSKSNFHRKGLDAAESQPGRAAVSGKKGQEFVCEESSEFWVLAPRMLFCSVFHFSPWEQKLVLHFNGFNYCMEIWTDRKGTGNEDAVVVYWASFELI